jgi:hypothetical protein
MARDEVGRVLCCHGRPMSCDECGEEDAAKIAPRRKLDAMAMHQIALVETCGELLAALKTLVEMYGPSTDYDHVAQIAWADAEDAIAKAEGN